MMQASDIITRCDGETALALATRVLLEHTLQANVLNELFDRVAQEQYTRKLLFSDIVGLMGAVVQRMHPSVHAAYRKSLVRRDISLASLYEKINHIEPDVSAALVAEQSTRLAEIVDHLSASLPSLVPGYQTRIVDGNAIAATEHRLEVLRDTRSGALPGKSLAILDYERDIVTTMIPCLDGHAQERSLSDALIAQVQEKQLWVADRNFCTAKILMGIAQSRAAFLIREHRLLPLQEETAWQSMGDDSNILQEQRVAISFDGKTFPARRIKLKLAKATRDGDREIIILTTLPSALVSAEAAMELYRKRWRIESMFANLTSSLRCEVPGLGHPRAALFVFATAVVAANTLAVIRAALRHQHGQDIEERLSIYQMVDDLQSSYRGLAFIENSVDWNRYAHIGRNEFHETLCYIVERIDVSRYPKAKTRPRKPRPSRGSSSDPPHVSTHRLLEEKKLTKSARKSP